MRTLGMLTAPGTWAAPGQPRVGRTVANAELLRALLTYGQFDELALFTGETADLAALEQLTDTWNVPEDRLAAYSLWQLPELLARGRLDVLHHASHVDRLLDLVATRDRFSSRAVPVTGQTHSLSYPRLHQDFARLLLVKPSATDAVFCSSTAGQRTMQQAFELLQEGAGVPVARFELPHVPLGVDTRRLVGGTREQTRQVLNLPKEACVALCLARFTEHDKLDLFPVLRVLERMVRAPTPGAPPIYLLLAGARQGTKTPEMLELWARHLGIADRLRLKVDFTDAEKKDLLAAADLFVSPVDNVQETFGQSVVEAMAAGLPLVVSDFDGYTDTVDDEVGVRIPTRRQASWSELSDLSALLYERPLHLVLGQSVEVDLPALEAALRELVADAPRRERLGRAAALRAKTRYDWEVVVPSFEYHWQRLALQPWRPSGKRPPLRLDYERLFGHFTSHAPHPPQLEVTRTSRANELVLYPELKHLFVEADVQALLAAAEPSCTVATLRSVMDARLEDRRGWVTELVIGWLFKQGLIAPA